MVAYKSVKDFSYEPKERILYSDNEEFIREIISHYKIEVIGERKTIDFYRIDHKEIDYLTLIKNFTENTKIKPISYWLWNPTQ